MPRRHTTPRGSRGYRDRLVKVRDPRQSFLIVCEGIKTEPLYFERFQEDHRLDAYVRVLGKGVDPAQLIDKALVESEKGSYDQVWCVFDRDSWLRQNFNSALAQAKRHEIRVAYSNEAFELWYLLHFNYYDTAMTRQQYIQKLEELLGHTYEKNSPATYGELRSRQQDALRNARNLLAQYDPPDPVNDNPSTMVHLLVEELLRFAR